MTRASRPQPSRRNFLKTAAYGGAALGAGCSPAPESGGLYSTAAGKWEPRVSENIGSLDDATLTWMAQLGHKWVVYQGTGEVDQGGKGYWSLEDIEAVQGRCREFGMELASLMIPINWLMASMLGNPERDDDIENIIRSLEAAGKAGVDVLEWRWSPDFEWGEEGGYYNVPGRGGAVYKAFDYDLIKDKPPWPQYGVIPRDVLFERLVYFAGPVMKAAESAGVKLSLHPKDPPVKSRRGVDRIITNTEEIEEFLDAVDSPANGFTFCQGTVTEMGVDVVDAIRRIGGRGRIHHVHFRAVRGAVPKYVEVFIDEGDVDMLAAMRAYKEAGYTGTIVSDHTPRIPGELPGGKVGRSFSHGYIRGLIQAVNAEDAARRS